MPIRVEKSGPVTTVILARPEARNAVDGPTAAALSDAFREFDADGQAKGFEEPLASALSSEFARGVRSLESGEASVGALRFAAGAGRHGKVE